MDKRELFLKVCTKHPTRCFSKVLVLFLLFFFCNEYIQISDCTECFGFVF